MAITTNAIANSFKGQILRAIHNFTASTGNTFKLAMYTNAATLGASTTYTINDTEFICAFVRKLSHSNFLTCKLFVKIIKI